MSMTPNQLVELKQEIRKRQEEEVARLEVLLAQARYKLQCDEEDEAAALEAALGAKPTEAA